MITIFEVDSIIYSLCSYNGQIYSGVKARKIYNVLSKEEIVERKGSIFKLCENDGKLYDGGAHGLFNTFSELHILDNREVVYMLSVPRSIIEVEK